MLPHMTEETMLQKKRVGSTVKEFYMKNFICFFFSLQSFFGRTYNNVSGISDCKNGGRCEITKKNRTSCKSCRLRKCVAVGMSKSGSRYGRRSNWFKIHCLLSAQSQNGGGLSGSSSCSEANNNNSSTTNNNNPPGQFPPNSLGKSPLPSTATSMSSEDHREMRERERDRERTPSSNASRNGGLPPAFSSFAAGLSPDAREQFLASLNRKLVTPELADYFRAAGGLAGLPGHGGFPLPGKPLIDRDDDRGDDIRPSRSPGSLESPNSEASADENKLSNGLFAMPPGSPLEMKPNDLLSFDFLTRLGYDPLRLWPMLSAAPPNLHQFNPYRFILPGAAFPGAFPPGFPPPNATAPSMPSPLLSVHPSKLLSAAALSESLTSSLPSSSGPPTTPTSNHGSPTLRSRVTPVVPPSSSLTLTPPISHHSSDEPVVGLSLTRNLPSQDMALDLSARSTNNNYPDDDFPKKFARMHNGALSPNQSDSDDDMRGDLRHRLQSDRDYDSDNDEPHALVKHEVRRSDDEPDSEEELGEAEDLRSNNNNEPKRRRSSSSSRDVRSPKRERVSTPLDLTRSTSSTPVAPPKIELHHKVTK